MFVVTNFRRMIVFVIEGITLNSECVEWVYDHSANLIQ